MADSLPAVITATVVPDPTPDTATPCAYLLPNGAKCQTPQASRGFCATHYQALRRAGAFGDLAVETKSRDQALKYNVRAVRRARRKLLQSAPDIVDTLVAGMKIAAQKGDTSAAQWAILHTRVLEPVLTGGGSARSSDDGAKFTINVGVKVSGTESK